MFSQLCSIIPESTRIAVFLQTVRKKKQKNKTKHLTHFVTENITQLINCRTASEMMTSVDICAEKITPNKNSRIIGLLLKTSSATSARSPSAA